MCSPQLMKKRIREEFDRNSNVTDPRVADRLQHEAHARLVEAMYEYAQSDY